MNPSDRIVTNGPLSELWDTQGPVSAQKRRVLGRKDIADLLRGGPIRCAFVNVGHPLKWDLLRSDNARWKTDVSPRLVEPPQVETGFSLDDFPGMYCYVASEWIETMSGQRIVLFEMHH